MRVGETRKQNADMAMYERSCTIIFSGGQKMEKKKGKKIKKGSVAMFFLCVSPVLADCSSRTSRTGEILIVSHK